MTQDALSRASLRREAMLVPDGDRLLLLPTLARDEMVAPLAPQAALDRLAAYLLDPLGRAIAATSDELAAWIAGSPLMQSVGPGNGAPIRDDLAAVMVAPLMVAGGVLSAALWRWRWSPRADDLIGASVAALPPDVGMVELARLAGNPGPDEDRLHLSTLQAGRALAWSPHLSESPPADGIVDRLLALLMPTSPRPLLEEVVRALGPIARQRGALGARVRDDAMKRLGEAVARIEGPARPSSFSAELDALDRPVTPELEAYRALPDWEVAEHCAHLLGAGAPAAPGEFDAHRQAVSDRFGDLPLLPAFLDGLLQSAAVEPVADLVTAMAAGDEDDHALGADLSTHLPLPGARDALLALVEDERAPVRIDALRGLTQLGEVDTLVAMLRDPSPEVATTAAIGLVALGLPRKCLDHRPNDPNRLRLAAICAAAGANDTETVGELVVALMQRLEAAAADDDAVDDVTGSPLLDALATSLFGSVAGLRRAAALLGGVPAALPVVALAAARGDDPPGVQAPPDALGELREVLGPALELDDEAGACALSLLARLSCGDEALAARIAGALAATEGYAGHLLTALSDLRVRSPVVGAAVGPFLDPEQPIGARIIAAAAAGRCLPVDHAGWAHVIELLELGTIARAAAWTSLRDRVRCVIPS